MSNDLLLAVETSALHASVALGCGAEVVAWRALSAERRHTVELLPAIRDLLAEVGARPAAVQIVCFSQGPGSFTGLRVAATLARLWQSTTGCRVVAVSSLEVIARNALAWPEPAQRLAVGADARQGKVFGALFVRAGDDVSPVETAALHSAPAWIARLPKPCAVLGDVVAAHRAAIVAAGLTPLPDEYGCPDARQVLALGWRRAQAGQFCPAAEILPAYSRPPECEEVYEQRRAEARARRS